jgi:hypothetical protein
MSDETIQTTNPQVAPSPDALKAELEADERRTGNKDAAVNVDALVGVQGVEGTPIAPETSPSFFVQPTDRYRLELDILYDKKTGKVSSISPKNRNIDFSQFQFFAHSIEWFDFSIPTYEDMANYRQRCSNYRRDAGKVLVDAIQMRNFLLVWHLKDWSLRGADGKKVELKHNAEGALDDDSLKKAYQVSPTLIDVILTNFETEVILT